MGEKKVVDRLWTSRGGFPPFHTVFRERRGKGTKGGGTRRNGAQLVNRMFHSVEEILPRFPHAVEEKKEGSKGGRSLASREKIWYNRDDMQLSAPDFNRISAMIEKERARFDAFRDLLLTFNARFNLTAVTGEREILYKHFYDSLAAVDLFPQGASVAEVGSGAGFPSIPLMLVREDLHFSLFESTGKKCEFLRTAAGELGLHADVFSIRAEEAGRGEHRERYDVCCARAVARLDTLAEYCLPLVREGGRLIAYKGADSELEIGERALRILGATHIFAVSYELPEEFGARTLVVAEKGRITPLKYPRGRGAERKAPL